MINLENCFIYATEENFQALIDLGYPKEYNNVKENGIAWNGCYVIRNGHIAANGRVEYTEYLKHHKDYREVYVDKGVWYVFEKKIL